jgi:hypothetical protein
MADTDTVPAAPPVPAPAASAGDRGGWRVAWFVAGLVVVLIAGFGIGRAVGSPPDTDPAVAPAPGGPTDDHFADGHTHGPATAGGGGEPVGGLAISAGGYTLVPETTVLEPGESQFWAFRIEGPDGTPVRAFMVVHEQLLHLVVVRRDLTGYQHLHPTMSLDGTWQTALALPEPGLWRAYADFAVLDATGAQVEATLAVDLTVPGDYRPDPLPEPAADGAAAVDDLTVSYEGAPAMGTSSPVLFRVFDAAGAPLSEPALQPYLGAYGHLVAVRAADLGYLHVHSEPALAEGAVRFWLTAPSPGSYRLFFEFQVDSQVRRAEFTVEVL